ncbi:arabinanase/levansucrase/invertase [Actinidia rufa]|uniref:Arabinanase/levansucrase/invertase n=1 Tax=Actinidia rufa TaxID=165716 RepID=A0A7J0EM63_9ERIC|nr:arabinanase/levansucrase/invertase [Actinidia rufa]
MSSAKSITRKGLKFFDDETGNTTSSSNVFKSFPGLAMSQDGRHWARIEGEHDTGALFDVGSDGEWAGCLLPHHRDGIKWVKLGKIIGGGGNGASDEFGALNPRVVRNRKDGKYLMVYEGVGAGGQRSIGLAMLTDGLKNWERVQGGTVLKPSEEGWDNKEVGSPCLVQMDGNIDEWRLYYRGIGERGEVGIRMAMSEGSEIRSLRRWTGFDL